MICRVLSIGNRPAESRHFECARGGGPVSRARDTVVCMTMGYRRSPRTGLAVASAALVIAAAAAVTSGLALAHPIEPARHTVNVVAPPPATYTSSETEAAKAAACTAWDRMARSTALASRASADALEQSWTSPESREALATEKRTGMAAFSYLRTQITDATPASADPNVLAPFSPAQEVGRPGSAGRRPCGGRAHRDRVSGRRGGPGR